MAVTRVAGTGTLAPIAEGTDADVTWVGVAADRLALLSVACKYSSRTVATPPGWTELLQAAGGTGTEGDADNSPSRVAVFSRVLAGDETGTFLVSLADLVPGVDCIQAVLDIYESSTGAFEVLAAVAGSDDVHDGTRSVTTSSVATAGNDLLHVAFASDTDNNATLSALTVTQAGATVSTPALASRFGTTTAGDCAVITMTAGVIAGATDAVTVGYARGSGSTDCGPAAVVRLRSSAGAGVDGELVVGLPAVVAEMAGEVPVAGVLGAALPAVTVTAAAEVVAIGALDTGLPAAVAAASGVVGAVAVLDIMLPAATAAASGAANASALVAVGLPAAVASLGGDASATAALAATLPAAAAQAGGTAGLAGTLAGTLPAVAAALTGSSGDVGGGRDRLTTTTVAAYLTTTTVRDPGG